MYTCGSISTREIYIFKSTKVSHFTQKHVSFITSHASLYPLHFSFVAKRPWSRSGERSDPEKKYAFVTNHGLNRAPAERKRMEHARTMCVANGQRKPLLRQRSVHANTMTVMRTMTAMPTLFQLRPCLHEDDAGVTLSFSFLRERASLLAPRPSYCLKLNLKSNFGDECMCESLIL